MFDLNIRFESESAKTDFVNWLVNVGQHSFIEESVTGVNNLEVVGETALFTRQPEPEVLAETQGTSEVWEEVEEEVWQESTTETVEDTVDGTVPVFSESLESESVDIAPELVENSSLGEVEMKFDNEVDN